MRQPNHFLAFLLGAFLIVPHAVAAACPQHFFGGSAPILTNPKLAPKTRQICYTEFALLHSGLTRTPLWVAEHLTPRRVKGARALNRLNNFHADPNLPPNERAELSDYVRSGFDRGHMAPAGDMTTPQGMNESFSLANMVPQNSDNNRNLWESIERAVRDYSERHEVYVVTGPIFQGENLQALKGRVLVPTHIAKAVYDPQSNIAGAYLVSNQPGNDYRIISLAELQQLSGIDAFPQLSASVKQTTTGLPVPQLRRPRGGGRSVSRPSVEEEAPLHSPRPSTGGFVGDILDAIDQFGRRP
ncbi:endonuclease [Microvirga vignae]|uniref:Endonuclease n=1 Tax=Microvirga vignae TaxID=1225564 RepID=A0A0H1R9M0_9HYPH|nr:DNA/RNA non-specific endonuclease [Microvirga vignae]KLK91863.1 endonuclease [Microvirga vignae]